jgi:hypothetical protein
MAWITPKTNWSAQYSDTGLFIGDFFNVTDYNRIKNNLLYLRELATQLMLNVPVIIVGADKHYPDGSNPDFDNDHFFADEINLIEDGLEALDKKMGFVDFGEKQTFYENGRFIDADELNRIERAELELYNLLNSSLAGRQRLSFSLGTTASTIKV